MKDYVAGLLQIIIAAAVIGLFNSSQHLKIEVAVLATKVGNLEDAVRSGTSDMYTGQQAKEAWKRQESWNRITDKSLDFLEMSQDEFDKRLYLREHRDDS